MSEIVFVTLLLLCCPTLLFGLYLPGVWEQTESPKSPNEILGAYLAVYNGEIAGKTISNQNAIYNGMFENYVKSLGPVAKFQQDDETTTVIVYLDFYAQWLELTLDGRLSGSIKVEASYQDDRLRYGDQKIKDMHLPFWVDPDDLWMPDIYISQR